MTEEVLLTSSEVCAIARIHRNTLYRWIADGTLPAYRFGKEYRFKRSDLDRALAPKPVAPAGVSSAEKI